MWMLGPLVGSPLIWKGGWEERVGFGRVDLRGGGKGAGCWALGEGVEGWVWNAFGWLWACPGCAVVEGVSRGCHRVGGLGGRGCREDRVPSVGLI